MLPLPGAASGPSALGEWPNSDPKTSKFMPESIGLEKAKPSSRVWALLLCIGAATSRASWWPVPLVERSVDQPEYAATWLSLGTTLSHREGQKNVNTKAITAAVRKSHSTATNLPGMAPPCGNHPL